MGRPRKPAAARAREGGTAKRGAVSHRPQPATEIAVVAGRDVPVSPPDDLPEHARELWVEIVRVLAEAGIVDRVDLPALRWLCLQHGRGWTARRVIDEPVDEESDHDLGQRLSETAAILRAQKFQVANALRAGVDVPPGKLNAISTLEVTLANLEAYRAARRKVGNLVALGSTGQLVEHPLVATERAAASLVLRYASRFGLTPADRAALGLMALEGSARKRELDAVLGASGRPKT